MSPELVELARALAGLSEADRAKLLGMANASATRPAGDAGARK